MVDVVDTTQQLTITLLTEGFGAIVSFTADKTTAREGETINLSFTLRNDGDTADDLFGQVIDVDTSEIVLPNVTFPAVGVGSTVAQNFTMTMPNKSITLQLEAGHVE